MGDGVAVLAVVLTVVFAWPQVVRALRHGVEGISSGAITLSFVAASAWFGYGVATGQAAVIVANLGVMAGQLTVTFELVRGGALARARALGAYATAVALIALCQVDALTDPIVSVAGIVAIVSVLTQLVQVVREPHRLEGLSASTYALLTALSVSWVVYGVIESDVVIIVTNVVIAPMAASITWRAGRSHHEVDDATR